MDKLLIIDDTRDLLHDVVDTLELEGYDAYGAESGEEGVKLAKLHKPDLIVCDIMMPGMDGFDVLKTLRHDSETSTIPFIFMTAKTGRDDRRMGMNLGADDFITKPFAVDELLESITTQLRKRRDLNHAAEEHVKELRETIVTALPHELRTPLNTIIGFADMLEMEANHLKPDQIIAWAQHIGTAADRLLHLNENYLYYIRLQLALQSEAGIRSFGDQHTLYPHKVIEEYVTRLFSKADRMQDLKVDFQPASCVMIATENLNKVIHELVDNALKFSEVGQPVEIYSAHDDTGYCVVVRDYGRGMTPEEIAQIQLYKQFNRSEYEQQGLGMGLAIVKDIVRLCKGSIHFHSEPNSGLEVNISFKVC